VGQQPPGYGDVGDHGDYDDNLLLLLNKVAAAL
jgi:hypothetical protein